MKAITLWQLSKPREQMRCVICERDRRWQLLIQSGRELVIAELHQSNSAAFTRAHEIWQVYRDLGWSEPMH